MTRLMFLVKSNLANVFLNVNMLDMYVIEPQILLIPQNSGMSRAAIPALANLKRVWF